MLNNSSVLDFVLMIVLLVPYGVSYVNWSGLVFLITKDFRLLQLIPQISSLSVVTTIVPLVFVLAVTAVKDGVEDYNRHKSDDFLNNKCTCYVLTNRQWKQIPWKDVKVGDIIKVTAGQNVPADFLYLGFFE